VQELDLTDVYDEETLTRIETAPRAVTGGSPGATGARRRVAAGSVVAGVVLGLREVLDAGPEEEPVVIEVDAHGNDADLPVRVRLTGDPRRSWARVRPWLL
jgi:anti-sigma-K factor RskA